MEADRISKLEAMGQDIRDSFKAGRESGRHIRIVVIHRIPGQPIGIVIGSFVDDLDRTHVMVNNLKPNSVGSAVLIEGRVKFLKKS
jgi:hypothetical protein